MIDKTGGLEANRTPTDAEIYAEVAYLDAIGIMVSGLVEGEPIIPDRYIDRQPVLGPIIDQMAERGWAYVGAGYFSAAFVKGGLAVKIGLKPNDTGSMYAAWCRAHQGEPGVPVVYAVSKFSRCYVLLTRRYEKLDRHWVSDDDHPDYVPELAEEFQAIRAVMQVGADEDANRFDTVTTAKAIRDFFHGVVDFDLHTGNVMMDDQGELVITDPISFGACSASYERSYCSVSDGSCYEYDTFYTVSA